MTSFHDVMRGANWQLRVFAFLLGIAESNAFLTFKKWRNGASNVTHFDFRRQLAHEMISENYLVKIDSPPVTRSKTRLSEVESKNQLRTIPKKRWNNLSTTALQIL